MRHDSVVVIGAGLAGSEAAMQIAKRGVPVDLFEMRPARATEAHVTADFAELVCSNSFGSTHPGTASQLLKEELGRLGSLILTIAHQFAVRAGSSLAVDRILFSKTVTDRLCCEPNIVVHRDEVLEIPKGRIVVVASGPLTSHALATSLSEVLGGASLFFYDAISPIVSSESLDPSPMFFASRYGRGEADFLNIPLTKPQYEMFVEDLRKSEVVVPHDFEDNHYFESCLPIEVLAARGPLTLAFGPMKPVGLIDPKTGRRPFAVVQLRAENRYRTAYNLVGFQTKMKYREQERVFRKLPGLLEAEFLRLGSMHRNTYIDSPRVLRSTLQLRNRPEVLIAGQLTGTEGYLESCATGLWAGLNAVRLWLGLAPLELPPDTMLGSLLSAISDVERNNFQPMNANLGILPPLVQTFVKDKVTRNKLFAQRALLALELWMDVNGVELAPPGNDSSSRQLPCRQPTE